MPTRPDESSIIAREAPLFFVPETQSEQRLIGQEKSARLAEMSALLRAHNACLVAHYYTDPLIQELAEQSGGFIGDSLEMAKFGKQSAAQTLVVAGVKFMGETAKILSPEKTVLMPTLEATCSLDLGCPAEQLAAMKAQHPDRVLVVYANTSAAVKAMADWVVTSSMALPLINHLRDQGQAILWAPDKHLGSYLAAQSRADMLLWNGSCIVHEEFKAKALRDLKALYPEAGVLVHPESPADILAMADVVGSTTQLLNASRTLSQQQFIVATDRGIFYKMQQASPEKMFIEAPTAGNGATCRSCAHCPWMAMNTLDAVEQSLLSLSGSIELPEALITAARRPLERMLAFSAQL